METTAPPAETGAKLPDADMDGKSGNEVCRGPRDVYNELAPRSLP